MVLSSVGEVIEAFGGRKKFAKVMRTTPQAVDNWRRGMVFPANTYVMLQAKLHKAGMIVPNNLWAMRGNRRRR